MSPTRLLARRFGWTSLWLWALVGLMLEAAHGWKLSAFLDDELTHTLLRLGHAHGVGLALLTIVHGELGTPLLEDSVGPSRAIWLGSALMPLGFSLGAIAHPEGDPNALVLLVPLGAAALLYGLGQTAWASWHTPAA